MTTTVDTPVPAAERPPAATTGPLAWLRANLFDTWYNALLTILILWALARAIPPLIEWAVLDAAGFGATSQMCREASGACWGFVREKLRFILFGTFPYDQQWRPLATLAVFIALLGASCNRRFWSPWFGLAWLAGLAA
ncbi:amino acid ABC transporter permease, partial [Azospirillum sp. A39]